MPNQADAPIQLHSHDLKNTRDLRTLLLEAAYASLELPAVSEVHIYLHHCTLAKKRVVMEFEQFKRIALPKLAKRLYLHDARLPDEYKMVLSGDAVGAAGVHARKPNTASQEAVVAYLLT